MRRTALTLVLIPLVIRSGNAEKPPQDPGSEAITSKVLDAAAQELNRSTTALKVSGTKPPYFVGYKLTEVEVNDAVATLGGTTASRPRHFVNLEAHVHVGDYKFDNSNFIASGRDGVDGIADITLPLEPNPDLVKRSAWLATDAAYKEALAQMAAKQEAIRTGAGLRNEVPSYSQQKPRVDEDPVHVRQLEPISALKERAENVSAAFRDMPHIRDSRVAFTSYLERRWYLNSEGTNVHDTRRVSGLIMVATAQASDGQELSLYYSKYGHDFEDLPDDKQLSAVAKEMASNLEKLQSAPLSGPYTGPVLFEGSGAVGVIRNTLAQDLSGTPVPMGASAREALRFGGALLGRLNLPVLSQLLSLTDDPTTHEVDGTAVIGGYKLDDEGSQAKSVQVIKNGRLLELLLSRTPNAQQSESNGHARSAMPGGIFRGSTTNLMVSSKGGVARKALIAQLLKQAKAQGLPYAMIIRQFDDPMLTANSDLTRLERLQLLQGTDENSPPVALLAYRVYPNGKEELVRGVQVKPIDLRAWRDVIGTSQKRTVENYLASTEDLLTLQIAGGTIGFVPSAGVESSIATPDLLFREIDIEPATSIARMPKPIRAQP